MHASSSVATTNAEELAMGNRKLESSDDKLDLVNKRFDEVQGKSELNCCDTAICEGSKRC